MVFSAYPYQARLTKPSAAAGQACDRKQYGAARSHNSRQEGWMSRAYWVSVRLGVKLSHSPHAGQCQKNTLERKLQRLQR